MGTEPFIIEANDTIEIHFSEPISSLQNFFNGELDIYSQSIIYIDLSHFNSSLVENIDQMLYKYDNLEYLDISNFNPNVDNLTLYIDNIKYINLNNLTTQKLIKYI